MRGGKKKKQTSFLPASKKAYRLPLTPTTIGESEKKEKIKTKME